VLRTGAERHQLLQWAANAKKKKVEGGATRQMQLAKTDGAEEYHRQ
jgi:hypothetical protein